MICIICSKAFEQHKRYRNGKQKFCSNQCRIGYYNQKKYPSIDRGDYMNPENLIRSRTQRAILEVAKRQGYIHKKMVHALYSTEDHANKVLDFLRVLGLLKPEENDNIWVYTKSEPEGSTQRKLEVENVRNK